jgi:hypothetical protein
VRHASITDAFNSDPELAAYACPSPRPTAVFEKYASKREHGIVPDFKLVPDDRAAQLAYVKTIGFAKARYGRSAARRGGTLPCDERAGIVDREYRLHAEKLDKKLHPDEASPGSFERRLGSFGSVVGFVAGYFGELSKGAAHEVLRRKILLYLLYCPYLLFATSD